MTPTDFQQTLGLSGPGPQHVSHQFGEPRHEMGKASQWKIKGIQMISLCSDIDIDIDIDIDTYVNTYHEVQWYEHAWTHPANFNYVRPRNVHHRRCFKDDLPFSFCQSNVSLGTSWNQAVFSAARCCQAAACLTPKAVTQVSGPSILSLHANQAHAM